MRRTRKILVVADAYDQTAQTIAAKLRHCDMDPIFFSLQKIALNGGCSLAISNRGEAATLKSDGIEVATEEIHSVWWRRGRKPVAPLSLEGEEARFAAKEYDFCVKGFWSGLNCYWMSNPDSISMASIKPEQLRRARAMGFEIPKTLITTNPDEVVRFYRECGGRMIYKTLSSPVLGGAGQVGPHTREVHVTKTRLITPEMLEGVYLSSIATAPCQFQEYIDKRCEYRVTVIGDRVFAAEIDSQSQPETKLDWRHYEVPMRVRNAQLPDEVAARVLKFVKSYNLNFGAVDLIRTPDDRYVFLENNPNGQWLFLEYWAPELRMAEHLVKCLSEGHSS